MARARSAARGPLAAPSGARVHASSGHLPATPASVPQARRFVVGAVRGVLTGEALETARLLVSELVTNAVLHAGSEACVEVTASADVVRVEVHDASAAMPRRRRPRPLQPGGRGLQLVAALSSRWGAEPTPGGKVVWFELDRR
jgi:anti-sigma regulatory factor (Ser/Thr protein kinase)